MAGLGIKSNVWKTKTPSQLPLYKDKPFEQSPIAKSQRRKKMLYQGFLFSIFLYTCYYIGTSLRDSSPISRSSDTELWKTRQDQVRNVFLESWHDYEKHGWGKDVYHPISQKGENMGPSPLGWMIVDSLDTLIIMGLDDETRRAREWVRNELTYDFDYEVNVFETTIRMLGGFLSAYHLSKDDVYLDKAVDLGNRLLGGFNSQSGLPYASVNLKTGKGIKSHVDSGASSTAEVSTLQLEFKYLAKLTGENLYWEKAEKVMEILDRNHPQDGLVPIFVQPDTGKYQGRLIRLGSRGDSYYEYLLKQFLQTNRAESVYNDMYRESVNGIKQHMVKKSKPSNYVFIGELDNGIGGSLSNKMDHLVCFMGGLLALGATNGDDINSARKSNSWSTTKEADFMLGKELTHTCYKMYHDVEATGLSPEIVVFNTDPNKEKDFSIKPLDRHNLQRPETVESLYYLYSITKDPIYRKWGWELFENFVRNTKVTKGGVRYTSLNDVTKSPSPIRDNLESFWLAETLKYFYLLFDDSGDARWDLTNVVFNTEAHPFPRFDMDPLFKTGWARHTNWESVPKEELGEVLEPVEESPPKPRIQAEKSLGVKSEKAVSADEAQKEEKEEKAEKVEEQGEKADSSKRGSKAQGTMPSAQPPNKPIEQQAEDAMVN